MSSLASLKLVQGLNSFAMLLGMKPAALAYILYKLSPARKYKSFDIEKKSGGVRKIMAPEPRLKLVQRRLADLLLKCQSEIEISIGVKDEGALAHGFKPRLSISTNAEKHRNRRWVFNADIEDFFPTINFGRVYGFFQKNNHFALSKPVATIIAQIACHENKLPQGSPCSPVISNIIAHILDIHLNDLASKHNCTYTRYADDLTFSTNEKRFPRAIAERQEGNIHTQHSRMAARAGLQEGAKVERVQAEPAEDADAILRLKAGGDGTRRQREDQCKAALLQGSPRDDAPVGDRQKALCDFCRQKYRSVARSSAGDAELCLFYKIQRE